MGLAVLTAGLGLIGLPRPGAAAGAIAGWGVDGCTTVAPSDAEFPGYVRLLEGSGVRWVRERDLGKRVPDGEYDETKVRRLRALKQAGFLVTAFAAPRRRLPVGAGDALPRDLLAVFREGRSLGRDFAGLVDAWELPGEPDVGFCPDLPERNAAYQKALYLGIKQGALERGARPPVLMGALALPPGPWLARAAANGLLDYTDGDNFHFYGRSGDLTGVIRAHRAFAAEWRRSGLPVWITECGLNSVRPDAPFDPARRALQAEFILSTARQARNAEVAVFMPFVLAHGDDPYALTAGPDRPFPAWSAYGALSRREAWPSRTEPFPAGTPNSVVLQWSPDNATVIPHKVSGTYRFLSGGRPIRGELRLYNFGRTPARGTLRFGSTPRTLSSFPERRELLIPPESCLAVSGEFQPQGRGYFQDWPKAEFTSADGSVSPLSFGLEIAPQDADFSESPLRLESPPGAAPAYPAQDEFDVSRPCAPWVGINGVRVDSASPSGGRFTVARPAGASADDPLRPPMAAARCSGLPEEGFLILRSDDPGRAPPVRVDLIDSTGQRFTVWENLGRSYLGAPGDVWLNLRDFHVYFWGRCDEHPSFHAPAIREVQLRFYPGRQEAAVRLELLLAKPKAPGG